MIIAFLTVGTMGLSNTSLGYLNYPTQVIFKCCKLIPVMIGGVFIQGQQTSWWCMFKRQTYRQSYRPSKVTIILLSLVSRMFLKTTSIEVCKSININKAGGGLIYLISVIAHVFLWSNDCLSTSGTSFIPSSHLLSSVVRAQSAPLRVSPCSRVCLSFHPRTGLLKVPCP